MSKFCGGCGAARPMGAKFCSVCGGPFPDALASASAADPGQPAAVAAPAQQPPAAAAQPQTNTAASFTAAALVYVGFWKRVGASLVDNFIILVIWFFLALLIRPLALNYLFLTSELGVDEAVEVLGDFDMGFASIVSLCFTFLYWYYRQTSPGKMAFSSKIVSVSGGEPTVSQYVLRYIGYVVSAIPLGLGFVWVGIDAKKQGWHDKMAGTVVVQSQGDPHAPPSRRPKGAAFAVVMVVIALALTFLSLVAILP
jgi:uncharacterized RDD family membrane protein YckC